jgi:hypothetical protein
MVQAITGVTRAEAARQVRLGEALGEADAAARLRAAMDGENPTMNGTADRAKGGAEAPWYAPITDAATAHRISAEAGAGN